MDVFLILLAFIVLCGLIFLGIKTIEAVTDIVKVVSKFANVVKNILGLDKTHAQNFNIGIDFIAAVFCFGALYFLKDDPVHYRLITIGIVPLIIFTCMRITFNKS